MGVFLCILQKVFKTNDLQKEYLRMAASEVIVIYLIILQQ